MAFFDDMNDALAVYPVDDVLIEIIDFSAPGDVLNQDEEATFKVKVTNTGPLNLTGVTLRVQGRHGARLKRPPIGVPNTPLRESRAAAAITASLYVDELVSAALPDIRGHGGSRTSETFTLKAPDAPQASQILIKATLEAWNANLDHILNDHSDPLPDAPKGTYSTEVVAE
jgi:hypothetical protein